MKKNLILRIASCGALCLLLSSCGAILEEAAEQALDRGGVDVELDDLEDGEFTITVENDEGEEATIEVDGEQGSIAIESEEGEGEFSVNAGLPEGWPDEFPLPDSAMVLTSFSGAENEQLLFNAMFSGPDGSLDDYLEHFRGLDLPIASENEINAAGSQQFAISWGTEEEPIANLVLTDATGTVGGQLFIQLPN